MILILNFICDPVKNPIWIVVTIIILFVIFRIFWNVGDEWFGVETNEQKRRRIEEKQQMKRDQHAELTSQKDKWIHTHYNDKNIRM